MNRYIESKELFKEIKEFIKDFDEIEVGISISSSEEINEIKKYDNFDLNIKFKNSKEIE